MSFELKMLLISPRMIGIACSKSHFEVVCEQKRWQDIPSSPYSVRVYAKDRVGFVHVFEWRLRAK